MIHKLRKRTRSNDGLTLLMSSSDGFCSNLAFGPGELGQVYSGHVPTAHHPSPAISIASSAQQTPTLTPTATSTPSFEKHWVPSIAPSVSPAPMAQPPSPTRSNSTSSNATQAPPTQTSTNVVISNPTPTLGNIPGVTAPNISFTGLPWTTPPQTPMAGVTGVASAASSVSGSVLGKRDTSESEKEDHPALPKKRRIAPTPVGADPPGGSK